MKKIVYTLLSVFSTAALLVSCTTKPTDEVFTPILDTETECNIKMVGDYSNFEAMEKEFNRFNAYYPNVSLDYIKLDDYINTLLTVLEGHDKPNIFFSYTWFFDNEKYKPYGVFRYHGNNKWYGLIMHVNKAVFGEENKEEYVDVINVRIDEERRNEILKEKAIYPSYHMNKQKWVSILLDESLKDEEVMEYIDWSRNFMIGKTNRKGNEPLYFIQPCNPKYYDLEAAFIRDNGVTGWKQSRKVNVGDICYMYIANPVGAVKYKCEVVETDIPFEYKGEDVSINKLMKIKLLKRIDNNKIDFKFLKSIGISLIRGPVSINKDMAEKIDALMK